MKKTILFAFAFAALFAAQSCSKCFTTDCATADVKRILFYSKADSSDLILTGKYLLDSLKITPLSESPSGPVPVYEINFTNPYLVVIAANSNAKGFVFQLDSLPPDTLLTAIGFEKGDKCCDGISIFDSLTLNGEALPNGPNDVNVVIFK